MSNWKLNSWRSKPVKHQPVYADKEKIDNVLSELSTFPPLVFAGESRSLKKKLGEVSQGKAFLLQGGDCAESFLEFHPNNIRDFLNADKVIKIILKIFEKKLIGVYNIGCGKGITVKKFINNYIDKKKIIIDSKVSNSLVANINKLKKQLK